MVFLARCRLLFVYNTCRLLYYFAGAPLEPDFTVLSFYGASTLRGLVSERLGTRLLLATFIDEC